MILIITTSDDVSYTVRHASDAMLARLRCTSLTEIESTIDWTSSLDTHRCKNRDTLPVYEETMVRVRMNHSLGHIGTCEFTCQILRMFPFGTFILSLKNIHWNRDEEWNKIVDALYIECCLGRVIYKTTWDDTYRAVVAIPMAHVHVDEWIRRCAHDSGVKWNHNINIGGRTKRCALIPHSVMREPVKMLIDAKESYIITDSCSDLYDCKITESALDTFPPTERFFHLLTSYLTMTQVRRLLMLWKSSSHCPGPVQWVSDDDDSYRIVRWIRRDHSTLWVLNMHMVSCNGTANAYTSAGGAALPN